MSEDKPRTQLSPPSEPLSAQPAQPAHGSSSGASSLSSSPAGAQPQPPSSAAANTNANSNTRTLDAGASASALAKKRKKKVQIACVFCRRSHMICDDKRPCTRCVKRNIAHLCRDEPISAHPKRARGDGLLEGAGDVSMGQSISFAGAGGSPYEETAGAEGSGGPPGVKIEEEHASGNNISNNDRNESGARNGNENSGNQRPPQESTALSNLYSTFSNSPPNSSNSNADILRGASGANSGTSVLSQLHSFTNPTNPFFYSEHANSEFSSLNEFLSMIDDPDIVNSVSNQYGGSAKGLANGSNGNFGLDAGSIGNLALFNNSNNNNSSQGFGQLNSINENAILENANSNTNTTKHSNMGFQNNEGGAAEMPTISELAKDKFFLTAADPSTEITPEERLKQVIKAKLDAGLLQPYNYAKGYARLQNYMDNYMNQQSRQRILKPLSIFRPAFRAIARTLKDVDLVLVEEAFERMLLDYDRVFTSMAVPACLWRRTGEIYRGNKEFAQLVEVNSDALKDGKLTIYELMSEESAVNFWEKYGAIAFDKGQKAVLTSCNLRTKDGRKRKACCFSFTIRRDRYNIPSCIVGNFIPIDS